MELYKTDRWTVLHPDVYTGNVLYGKNAMEIIDECDDVMHLFTMAYAPLDLHDETSVRRSNRVHMVGCLAILRIDDLFRAQEEEEGYTRDEDDFQLTDDTHEKIIKSAVKIFKKDLPMRARMLKNLYYRAYDEFGLEADKELDNV